MSFLSSQDISASRYKYEDHGPAEEIERKIAAGQTCDPQDETQQSSRKVDKILIPGSPFVRALIPWVSRDRH